MDGILDRAGYERLRDAEQANLDAIETELARLQRQVQPVVEFPPIEKVIEMAGGLSDTLRSADVPGQREVLAVLIERVVPIRLGRAKYTADITWTPFGDALHRLTEVGGRDGEARDQ